MKDLHRAVLTWVLCLCCASVFGAPAYIDGVPDWDQPILVQGAAAPNTGWNAWCVPSAASNIMGYYRDVYGITAIADPQVFTNTAAWPACNWQDDGADASGGNPAVGLVRQDIGWYMNTNDLGQGAVIGGTYAGTKYNLIKPGLDGILPAVPGWKGYFPDNGTNAFVTNAASILSLNTAPDLPVHTVGTVWPRIKTEIDAARPMIGSFSWFPAVGSYQQVTGSGVPGLDNYEFAIWPSSNPGGDPNTGEEWDDNLGHAITIVGYWESGNETLNPFYQPDQQWAPRCIIVHDNRDGYQANGEPWALVLPFDVVAPWTPPWVMNTEIVIPEPATVTLTLLACGALAALRRRRRR